MTLAALIAPIRAFSRRRAVTPVIKCGRRRAAAEETADITRAPRRKVERG